MACPFIEDPVDEEAALIPRELHLHGDRTLRPRVDFLTYPHGFLFERYRFSRHLNISIISSILTSEI